jgi:cytidine deaminase
MSVSSTKLNQMTIDTLLEAAYDAKSNAYCPYSNFAVGAAVLCEDGQVFAGCNVENASFGLTICAERNALSAAVANGHVSFKAIAVVTDASSIARPCGACRQFIAEFSKEKDPIVIVCKGFSDDTAIELIDELLPKSFNLI